ncbi:MAG: hypothetical protein KJ871_16980 [Alphaproteobacteria bacterium]|nr:hypothetical protein [Alphaproteobacteria bacterium]MBU2083566.1 hypothetical protein [Alphaproteobacteria bacterium]MBU2143211.1 hypothetical protein [Alphaproteobacteria bacterium]MBU2197826.1 hypothetical protein [Alphaproteobacteria bacterium]
MMFRAVFAGAVIAALAACTPAPKNAPAEPVAAEPAPAAAMAEEANLLAMMQGTWQSLEDPMNVFTISGDQMSSVYNEEPIGNETIAIVNDCTTMTPEADGMSFTLNGDTDDAPRCFDIIDAGADRLDYSYSARGNTLAHKRMTP